MKKVVILIALIVFFTVPLYAVEIGGLDIHGFLESAVGSRVKAEPEQVNLKEGRFQLKTSYYPENPELFSEWGTELKYRGDLLADHYEDTVTYNIRDFSLFVTPLELVDIKVGRQVLTWGTGDYIFINDLFPKDWISFYTGRDDEYLKLPSDAAKITLTSSYASVDVVYINTFRSDNIPSGERLYFYNYNQYPFTEENSDEIATRLFGIVSGIEWALYGKNGFFPQPQGMHSDSREGFYNHRIKSYGGSLRGALPHIGGIWNVELGYYDSYEDKAGTDPLIPNQNMRYMAGYSRDFEGDLTVGLQYYQEQIIDYEAYTQTVFLSPQKEFRRVMTLRIMKSFLRQTLYGNLFVFFSPSHHDSYLRPSVSWKTTDRLEIIVGANLFYGSDENTDWGSMKRNSNLYTRIQYSF